MTFTFADPIEWWFEVPSAQTDGIWQQVRSSPLRRWESFLNQMCWEVMRSTLRQDWGLAAESAIAPTQLPVFWEHLNGFPLMLGEIRLLLLPTEAIDDEELVVPQEWIDIPSFVSDYYLPVQISTDSEGQPRSLRVWGYGTHQDVKALGTYDADDHTYHLDAAYLNRDLSAFETILQFCPSATTAAVTQGAIAPLPTLTATQIENLQIRLSHPAILSPRLSIPFALWGSLFESERERQRLYQARVSTAGTVENRRVQLQRWFQSQIQDAIAEGWQGLENLLSPQANRPAWGFRGTEEEESTVRVKPILLASETAIETVMLRVALQPEADGRIAILAQVHPTNEPNEETMSDGTQYVPGQLSLSLLSDADEVLQTVQATEADHYIQLRRFRCPVGTRFSLQVEWEGDRILEQFEV
ncbi:MAG: DUF1822 family protein [Oculatellaceae cyanobacterium Prado106]|jgi:hypothetical protein|nr:DUF1822 family protein [Oculatellaceae cyanobacterium Prado106]